jgi:hypothetical protein
MNKMNEFRNVDRHVEIFGELSEGIVGNTAVSNLSRRDISFLLEIFGLSTDLN